MALKGPRKGEELGARQSADEQAMLSQSSHRLRSTVLSHFSFADSIVLSVTNGCVAYPAGRSVRQARVGPGVSGPDKASGPHAGHPTRTEQDLPNPGEDVATFGARSPKFSVFLKTGLSEITFVLARIKPALND